MGEGGGARKPFFEALQAWEGAAAAGEAFERHQNQPLADPPELFFRLLARGLADYVLETMRLPRSPAPAAWEWRGLYSLLEDTDPHYFTDATLLSALEVLPAAGEVRDTLLGLCRGYLDLRRQGFPARYPSPLLPNAEIHRWLRIFPSVWGWAPLIVLERRGLLTLASRGGFRALARFEDAVFEPPETLSGLQRWQAACWGAAADEAGAGETGAEQTGAFRAAQVAAAFAGDGLLPGALRAGGPGAGSGAEAERGPCGAVPRCGACPLEPECAWASAPLEKPPHPAAARALGALGQAGGLSVAQLLGGLLSVDGHGNSAGGGTSGSGSAGSGASGSLPTLPAHWGAAMLRELAGRTPGQVAEALGDTEGEFTGRLQLAFELARRINETPRTLGDPLATAWDVFAHLRGRLGELKQEQFVVVLLDTHRRFMGDHVVSVGTVDSALAHPREVFRPAIRESAAYLILVHNHPSGDPKPSKEDVAVTRQLMEAGRMIGIPVLDHIVVAGDSYVSLVDQGLIK